MKKKTILMAVGSSGGHIYPAVAVAEKLEDILLDKKETQDLQASSHSLDIHFVHSGSLLGKNIFSSLKYPVHEIPIGGLAKGQSFSQKVKSFLQIPKALIQSFLLIKKLKAQLVLGTGGAVTGPVLMTAVFMGCKTALWEGNALMGLANKWLTPFVSCIFSVFPELAGVSKKKHIVCSYPLRRKVYRSSENMLKEQSAQQKGEQKEGSLHKEQDIQTEEERRNRFNNKPEGQAERDSKIFKVLILGGSQGSVFLNQVVSDSVQESAWRKDIFIYHQTGEKHFDFIKEKYQSLNGIEPFAFSLNIEEYYKKADLIFSRAGSGAVWEAAFHGKALILIPLTYSAGGHQLKNALELSSKNCVEMIKEQDFNVKRFQEALLQFKKDAEKRKQLAQSLKSAYQGDGAGQIADWLLSV